MKTTIQTCYVGVDVSKATLDVYRPDTKAFLHIDNSQEGTEEFYKKLGTQEESYGRRDGSNRRV